MNQSTRLGSTLVEGMKTPVVVATTLNIALQGLPLISGVQLVARDRVLVKSQNNKAENGIYVVASGTWDRAKDFNASNDVVNGQLVIDSNSGLLYRVDFTGEIDLGVTLISFFVADPDSRSKQVDTLADWQNDNTAQLRDVVTTAERSTGNGGGATGDIVSSLTVTVNGFDIVGHNMLALAFVLRVTSPVNVRPFGATGDGVTIDTLAVRAAFAFGESVHIEDGDYAIDGVLPFNNDGKTLSGSGRILAVGTTLEMLGCIRITNTDNVTIKDIRIKSDTAYCGVIAEFGDNFNGIKPNTLQNYERIKIINCDFDCSGHTAIEFGHNILIKPFLNASLRSVQIIGNSIQGSGLDPNYLTTGNGSDNINVGSFASDGALFNIQDIIIANNTLRFAGRQNISITGGDGDGGDFVAIIGNTLRDTSVGGGVDLEFAGRVTITGNTFRNNGLSSHQITSGTGHTTSIRAGISFAGGSTTTLQGGYTSLCTGNTFDSCFVGINGFVQNVSACSFIDCGIDQGEFAANSCLLSNLVFTLTGAIPDVILIQTQADRERQLIKNIRIVDNTTGRDWPLISTKGNFADSAGSNINGLILEGSGLASATVEVIVNNKGVLGLVDVILAGYPVDFIKQSSDGGAISIKDSDIEAFALTDGESAGDASIEVFNSTLKLTKFVSGISNPSGIVSRLILDNNKITLNTAGGRIAITQKISITNNVFDLRGLTGIAFEFKPQVLPLIPFTSVNISNNEIMIDNIGAKLTLFNQDGATNNTIPVVNFNILNVPSAAAMNNVYSGKKPTGWVSNFTDNYYTVGDDTTVVPFS